MVREWMRPGRAGALAWLALAAAVGCTSTGGDRVRTSFRGERSLEELRASVGWVDAATQADIRGAIAPEELLAFAEQARAARRPATMPPKRSVLVISGGGAYGAYPAGVIAGWTESGTRPEFDVVTGVSTGAMVACFAFLGPAYDCDLRRLYTTIASDDILRRRRLLPSILSESLADSAPLARLIQTEITDERVQAIAFEHRKGRRLYVGTSDLDARRGIVWDIGAIAARDTPADRDLLRNILLASAAIPGFFPPVRIPVTVDGVRHVERHIDGGTSSSMFFVPPWTPPAERENQKPGWLHDSDLYILVAGKLYADPSPVKPRSLAIAGQAVSTVLYDQTRSDLHKLFLMTVLTGMNYHLSSIPADFPAPSASTDFDPSEMSRMFEAGFAWARTNRKWRDTPPGHEPGEGSKYRAGTVLTDSGQRGMIGAIGAPDCKGIPPVIPQKK